MAPNYRPRAEVQVVVTLKVKCRPSTRHSFLQTVPRIPGDYRDGDGWRDEIYDKDVHDGWYGVNNDAAIMIMIMRMTMMIIKVVMGAKLAAGNDVYVDRCSRL